MLLEECYKVFGGSLEAVLQRIPSEALVKKFALKFLGDPSFETLRQTLEEGEYSEAFRASHSLKGVCANLGFQDLEKSSGILTELLRHSEEAPVDLEACQAAFADVSRDYQVVIDTLKQLQNV